MIELGNEVRDNITGFQGVAVGRTVWLFGCSRLGLQARALKDGKTLEVEWFDEQRCELVKATEREISEHSTARTGGPMPDPRQPVGK